MNSTSTQLEHPTVFFDGVCNFCNRSVNFFLSRDRNGRLRFAPLQGTTAQELGSEYTQNLDTLVFRREGQTWTHSSAVVRILWTIGGFWAMMGSLLWLVPKPIRNFGYKVVAKNRYRWFGKSESCRIPIDDERARFLD